MRCPKHKAWIAIRKSGLGLAVAAAVWRSARPRVPTRISVVGSNCFGLTPRSKAFQETFDEALTGVQLDLNLPDLALPGRRPKEQANS
jgi:hypothetical protein